MATISAIPWPGNLPQCVQNWEEVNRPTTIRTEMDGGPPKVRRRYSLPMRDINVSMYLKDSQYKTLRDFFDQVLVGGVGHFTFTHPWTGEVWTLRFRDPPKFSPLGFDHVTAEMVWEQVP